VADLAALADAAGRGPSVELPREEPHPAGMVLGAVGFAIGALAAQFEFAGREQLGWVALAVLCAGMLVHARYKRIGGGWRVDFADRRVEPLVPRGDGTRTDQAEVIAGEGWSIQVAPGDRRAHVAIDLRQRERGRVVRLLDAPARRQAQLEAIDTLAATLARRLAIERSGPRLKDD
jgi:hypothetical protein